MPQISTRISFIRARGSSAGGVALPTFTAMTTSPDPVDIGDTPVLTFTVSDPSGVVVRVRGVQGTTPLTAWDSAAPYSQATLVSMDEAETIPVGLEIETTAYGTYYSTHTEDLVVTNQAPATPTGLALTPAANQITVDIDAASEPDFDYFVLERSPDNADWSVANASWDGSSYDDAGLASGTTYYYRAKAVDTAAQSSGYTASVTDDTTFAVPTGLTGGTPTSNTITWDWNDNAETDLNSYHIQWTTDDGGSPNEAGWTDLDTAVAVSTKAQSGLTANTKYWAKVRAKNDTGVYTAYSSAVSATTAVAESLPASVTHEYKVDEGSGTTIADSVGAVTGDLINTPSWGTGGVTLASASLQYASLPIDTEAVVSVGIVVYLNNAHDAGAPVSALYSAADTESLLLGGSVASGLTNEYCTVYSGAQFGETSADSGVLGVGWHSFVVTFTSGGAPSTGIMYIDGVLATPDTNGATMNPMASANGGPPRTAYVGRQRNTAQFYLDGTFGYLVLDTTTWTDQECQDVYNYMKSAMSTKGVSIP